MTKQKETQESPDGALVTAAKTIGAAAGKIAAAVGVATPEKLAKPKVPKLAKKNKARLPRRQKKAARKSAK
jgi:hypothetical protein